MIKRNTFLAIAMTSAMPVFAGGFVTNTNQSVGYFRMPAQEAVVSVDAAYFNPASIGFLDNGFQLGFNWQVASQTRESKTEYAPLAYGVKNGGSSSKLYKGEAFAPIVPSLDLAYVKDRWFVSDHFGVTGGGGKAEYANGLGSFESQVAGLAALLNTYPIPGAPFLYDVDMFLNGTQYSFSNQITGGFKLTDNLSVSAGVRMTYVQASYEAEIKNITINGTPAGAFLTAIGQGAMAPMVADRQLDCQQTGMGFAPILSADFNTDKLNIAVKYEFKTKIMLENSTKVNTSGLAQFDDKAKTAADVPAMLAVGVGYTPIEKLHLYASYHLFDDKNAETYNSATGKNDKQDLLSGNTSEYLAGIEYDLCDRLVVSCGAQKTVFQTGPDHKFLSDMSFSTNATSLGAGLKFLVTDNLDLNVGYFHSFFDHVEKTTASTPETKEDFFRTSKAFGAGINFRF